MNNKTIVGISVVALALAFASGRYSVSSPAVKSITDTIKDLSKDQEQDTHKQTTTITENGPSCKKTTITVTEDTITKNKTDAKTDSHIDLTVTPPRISTLNVSALAGISIGQGIPVYGVSITKQILGPLTVGGYGLNNGTIGVSLGINF